ncbi:type II toxin-antitoxin system ParD family antitoxin [Caballeronia sp. LZ008]|uniref:type II toxin-antitoxin system ParD family antitoxin n=1 Tax=Caballeronia sp. LZ008 TaxID=3038560 RepID=UPI00286AB4BD|nr:type II toxin-antitoxin system ParD family antitoxin [Caballeronia sp. LZ008]
MAKFVRTKAASGDHASDREVPRNALRALREGDGALKRGCETKWFLQRKRFGSIQAVHYQPTRVELKKAPTRRNAVQLRSFLR